MEIDSRCTRIVEPQIVTHCLICDEEIPVYDHYNYPRICGSCRKAILEVKVLLSELKKVATGGGENGN